MTNERTKYPKTMHFPWSPNLQNDDRMLEDTACFHGKQVVVTEKMDGENTTLYKEGIHARSLSDMAPHPSRTWIQSLHGQIKHDIPEGWRICGENLYAKHSIHYRHLRSYFTVFSIWNENNICLDWHQTTVWCNLLNLDLVPVIWHGMYDEQTVKIMGDIWMEISHPLVDAVEGYVVRNAGEFHLRDFQTNVAKYVRKGHVQTSEHWLNAPMVKNEIATNLSTCRF